MTSDVTYTIAAALANTFTYGILFILFVISMYLLGRNNAPPSKTACLSNRLTPVVLMSISLFVVVTAHWAVTMFRLFEAFASPTGSPVGVIEDALSISNITQMSLVFLSSALGDCIIIYRLWIIWGRNRIVAIFPTCSAIGESVAFTGLVYQFIRARTHLSLDFISSLNRWVIGACVFTLCTNVYCSGFILWRLWGTHRRNSGSGGDGVMRAAIMVIESAALYTSWATFFFATYEAQSGLYPFASTVWPPVTGIAIMLINVRVALSRVQQPNPIPAPPAVRGWKFSRSNSDLSSRNININITRTIDVDQASLTRGPQIIPPV